MDKNQYEIERHVYDVDIIEIFLRLKEKVVQPNMLVEGAKPDALIERWEDVIRNYCETCEIDFDESLAKGTLLVPNDDGFYTIALVLKLQAIEDFKIPRVLDYQKGLASNKAEFLGQVEFRVLNAFNNNAPFKDAHEKLDKISAWLSVARSKLRAKEVKVERDYVGLFRDKDFPEKLREILELNNVLDEGVWKGKSKHRTEINILIEVLIEKQQLKVGFKTEMSGLFCEEFGIILSKRSMRNKPDDHLGIKIAYQKMIPLRFEK